jgi:hypothetical protein
MSELSSDQRVRVPHDLSQQIRCVAIRLVKSGAVVSMDRPNRHHHLLHEFAEWIGRPLKWDEHVQGFLTMTGKFVTRETERGLHRQGQLYSEDLW